MNYLTKSFQDNNGKETIFEKKNTPSKYNDDEFDFTKKETIKKADKEIDEGVESLSVDELENKRNEILSHQYDFDFSKKSDDDLLESINTEITKKLNTEIKREQIEKTKRFFVNNIAPTLFNIGKIPLFIITIWLTSSFVYGVIKKNSQISQTSQLENQCDVKVNPGFMMGLDYVMKNQMCLTKAQQEQPIKQMQRLGDKTIQATTDGEKAIENAFKQLKSNH